MSSAYEPSLQKGTERCTNLQALFGAIPNSKPFKLSVRLHRSAGWSVLKQAGFCDPVVQHIPWRLTSPNAIALEHTLTAFIIGVVIGMRRFAHTEPGGADRALHAMLGL